MKKMLALGLCALSTSFVTADEVQPATTESTTEEVAATDEDGTVDAQKAKKAAQDEKSGCSSCSK